MATTADDRIIFSNVLHAKVSGKAYQILEQNPDAEYPALKLAFQAQFDKTDSYESLLITILNAKQDNDTTADFANRMENLLLKLNSVCANAIGAANVAHVRPLNERIVKRGFVDGLKSGLKFLVKARALDTLKNAIAFAVEEDNQFLSMAAAQNQISFKPFTPKQTNMSHNDYNSRDRQSHSGSSTGGRSAAAGTCGVDNRPIKVESISSHNGQSPTCAFCKKKGHSDSSCYKKHGYPNSGNSSGQASASSGTSANNM